MILKTNMRIMLLACSFFLYACQPSVERVATDSVTDLSGHWNDTDSRLVANEMIEDIVSSVWLRRFKRDKRRKPTLIIDKVRNLSHEHINTQSFISDMERSLINSGELDFVASSTERRAIRSERKDQDLHASDATRKSMGQEVAADFMLQGSINTIVDAISGEQIRYYQVDLTLIDIADNKKVWVGQKKIKKTIEKSGFRW